MDNVWPQASFLRNGHAYVLHSDAKFIRDGSISEGDRPPIENDTRALSRNFVPSIL